ncbi:uncharacterized protein sS8_0527 [Methylocaldum marinum]|uniref:Uncharacterized protein n=1 Tax=Methylocaldum marinum TaxID=1432792 RepID=A0A250KLN9_9GAMM|nr:uncharacterized protein sS8_0527 [Methylocaldum marinum]
MPFPVQFGIGFGGTGTAVNQENRRTSVVGAAFFHAVQRISEVRIDTAGFSGFIRCMNGLSGKLSNDRGEYYV